MIFGVRETYVIVTSFNRFQSMLHKRAKSLFGGTWRMLRQLNEKAFNRK